MDLENQRRVLALSEKYPPEDLIVILGGAEAEASGLACETVTNGDPTFAGPLAGVQLGLQCYHIVEDEVKKAVAPDVYQEQVGMMEMVLDVESIASEVRQYRNEYCHYLNQ
ncbi:glycine reductase complex GrdA [Escherichia coli TA206]|nr:glycine reductase complex GrdA [Escherichia coli TA206]